MADSEQELSEELKALALVYQTLRSLEGENTLRATLFWNLDKLGFKRAAQVVLNEVRDDA